MMLEITDRPIDTDTVVRAVAWPGAGAVLIFAGVARNEFEGRGVQGLHYEAYPEMAVPVMEEIQQELTTRWPDARVAMVHRVGSLEIGEASVVIVVAAPHRDAAYQASRFAIDQLKARVPIWKKEIYADGAAWKANAEVAVDE